MFLRSPASLMTLYHTACARSERDFFFILPTEPSFSVQPILHMQPGTLLLKDDAMQVTNADLN